MRHLHYRFRPEGAIISSGFYYDVDFLLSLLLSVSFLEARSESGNAVPDQGELRQAVGHLSVVHTVRARAGADTSPQRKDLGMVFGQSPLPGALRQASTDPSGCPRQRRRTAPDSQTRVSRQMPQVMKSQLQKPIRLGLRQAEIDNFGRYTAFLLQPHHDVCWLDISVDKVLFVNCSQTGSHLRRDFKRQLYFQSA